MDVNLWGVVHGTLAALQVMRGQEPDAADGIGSGSTVIPLGAFAHLIWRVERPPRPSSTWPPGRSCATEGRMGP